MQFLFPHNHGLQRLNNLCHRKKAACKKNSDQYVEYPALCQENGYIFSMFFNNIGALGFTTYPLIGEKNAGNLSTRHHNYILIWLSTKLKM